MDVLVFGGTHEGRELVEWLDRRGTCNVVACTATEYGASLLQKSAHVSIVCGPLAPQDKTRLMSSHDFSCIVDATHPYAQHISASIDELARAYGKPVVRLARENVPSGAWTEVGSAREAACHVASSTGNVLLTTGSKDLHIYTSAIPDFANRLYVRILPVVESLTHVLELGVPVSHVIAMQGPFSTELNCALIREVDARHVITKQSGPTGGFEQKAQAARDCGVELVVIRRPQVMGLSLEETKDVLEVRYGA